MKGLAAFLVGLVLAWPAHAYLKAGPAGYGHWLKSTTVQDGMATSLAAAYSFRKVRSAYAGPAVKLRRATGGTQDIGFTATGDFDAAAAATFCAATTCFLDTWYDQSLTARPMLQATPANQPQYIADCGTGKPCARTSAGYASGMNTGIVITPPAVMSIAVVGNAVVTGAGCFFGNIGAANQLLHGGGVETATITNGTAGIAAPASSNTLHTHIATMNGAASVLRIDGAETTGTTSGNSGGGGVFILASPGATCDQSEYLYWGGYALTADERLALANNQKNYYTPLPLDNFATPAAAYSMRRLKSSYSGPGIRLRRASDNAEADIGFLGFTGFTGAPIDTAAANAHCAATTCSVMTWYDQSGNSRHLTAAAANQPLYVNGCWTGGGPCAKTFNSTHIMASAAYTPAAVLSLSMVGRQERNAGTCAYLKAGNNGLYMHDQFDMPYLDNGAGGTIYGAGGAFQYHTHTGVINGAASVISVDGAEVTGTIAGATSAGTINFAAVGTVTCNQAEMVVWGGYALTPAERAGLTANQKSFWGIP